MQRSPLTSTVRYLGVAKNSRIILRDAISYIPVRSVMNFTVYKSGVLQKGDRLCVSWSVRGTYWRER